VCKYNGVSYNLGSRWPKPGEPGCFCECKRDPKGPNPKANCDVGQCPSLVPKCQYEGKERPVGSFINNAGYTCTCNIDGKVACGQVTTLPTAPPSNLCKSPVTGAMMATGAVVESIDKCKLYRCFNGVIEEQNKDCTCVYNGQNLKIGQTFNVECNTCVCGKDLRVTCSQNPCPCNFNNQPVQPGATIKAPDGCNTCTCGANRQMSCTNKPCECKRNGQVYKIGAEFAAGDNCNTCKCNPDAKITCTSKVCTCYYNGMQLSFYQTVPNDCNTCTCMPTGQVSCTNRPCSCTENGQTYRVGQTFAKDCNTCRCSETGSVDCTMMACGCTYNGRNIAVGETIMAGDGCTRLTCQQNGGTLQSDGGVNCPCTYNGVQYARGQTFPKPGDSCGNTCTCGNNRQVTCTSEVCCRNPMTNAQMKVGETLMKDCNKCTCMQSGSLQCENKPCHCTGNNGQKYPIGLSWVHSDGCNTCTCLQTAMIACDNKPCKCTVNGIEYPIGATWLDADGCQTWRCSENAVPVSDQKKCTCTHNGNAVQIGAVFPKGDGCNQCQCMQNLQVQCSSNPVPCKCQYQGMELAIGATRQQGCNTCTCLASGQVQCTNRPCECTYNGQKYNFGQTFPKGNSPQDACNTCTCLTTGQVKCTNKPCNCNYNGRLIDLGTVFNQDECNTCTCLQNGQMTCTNNPTPCNCKYGTLTVPIGDTFVQPGNNCNKCSCNNNGAVTCARDIVSCPISIPEPPKCKRSNGAEVAIGVTFKEDCNTCRCDKASATTASIVCTQKVCGCKESSNGRVYKAGQTWSPNKCTTCTCNAISSGYAPSCKKNPGCKV